MDRTMSGYINYVLYSAEENYLYKISFTKLLVNTHDIKHILSRSLTKQQNKGLSEMGKLSILPIRRMRTTPAPGRLRPV